MFSLSSRPVLFSAEKLLLGRCVLRASSPRAASGTELGGRLESIPARSPPRSRFLLARSPKTAGKASTARKHDEAGRGVARLGSARLKRGAGAAQLPPPCLSAAACAARRPLLYARAPTRYCAARQKCARARAAPPKVRARQGLAARGRRARPSSEVWQGQASAGHRLALPACLPGGPSTQLPAWACRFVPPLIRVASCQLAPGPPNARDPIAVILALTRTRSPGPSLAGARPPNARHSFRF
eukprot:scaffold589_cov343-Prasinococcus_capsulatus_cf.AAC.2